MTPRLLAELLEPILTAADDDEEALSEAVNLTAEAMAALGATVLDPDGQPARGVSDERAVVAALNTHAHNLMRDGQLDDVVEALQVAERIGRLAHLPHHPRTV
ncbi:hypothetical protein [Azospirillum sp. B506]|uniref:hypothetical protein n=1 Tax=Azospirillum sp. B506 TaxID=137721 RepID=UPI00034A0AEC|nr:hypothetical protein [Azospirillum sp. B506]